MKNVLLATTLALFFFSCSNSNVYEKAIAEYEQTIDNTTIDLSLKVIKAEKIKDITVKDSLDLAMPEVQNRIEEAKSALDKEIEKFKADSIDYVTNYSSSFANQMNEAGRKVINVLTDEYTYEIGLKEHIENIYAGRDPSEVIKIVVECTYSIKNPFLNNVKQEISKTYLMSPDGQVCYGPIDEAEN